MRALSKDSWVSAVSRLAYLVLTFVPGVVQRSDCFYLVDAFHRLHEERDWDEKNGGGSIR